MGSSSITIKDLFSLNQLFDFFLLIVYLKNLVKVITSYINSTQGKGIKERTVARISDLRGQKRELTNIASFLIFCSYMQRVLYHFLVYTK